MARHAGRRTLVERIAGLRAAAGRHRVREAGRRLLVRALWLSCVGVDEVLYRPAVVRLGLPLPRWWNCDLGRVSLRLDQRWGLHQLDGDPWPGDPCDICQRRAAIFVWGGPDKELDALGGPRTPEAERVLEFIRGHMLHLCGWCHLDGPIRDETELEAAGRRTRARSIAWRWRWTLD